MTTVVATRAGIYSDTLCTYTVPFKVDKIARIGESVYGGAGNLDEIYKFFEWKRSGQDVAFDDEFDVLEVNKSGIYLHCKKQTRVRVNEKFYAIGSGSQYAMGALQMGATPEQAIKIAAKFDNQTQLPLASAMLIKQT